jgi:hypothetical protein
VITDTFSTELTQLAPGHPACHPAAVRAAVAEALPLTYDGGTDLTLLTDLQTLQAAGAYDYAVMCSDGIDNFKRRPDMADIPFPIYVALTQGGVHGTDSALLQGIARLSGGVCMPFDKAAELVSIASGEGDEVNFTQAIRPLHVL